MNPVPLVLILLSLTAIAKAASNDGNPFMTDNDVTWTTLGTNENDSMPIGNGDLALYDEQAGTFAPATELSLQHAPVLDTAS